MVWRIHGGEVILISELSVINLRASHGEGSVPQTAHLSIYDVRYAPGTTPGSVAFVRHHGSTEQWLRDGAILTDSVPAADYIMRRLRSVGWAVVPLDAQPRIASFTRTTAIENVAVRITTSDLEVAAEWQGLFGRDWGDGPSNSYPNEHAWAFVLEASEAHLALNGVRVEGEVFPDERFRPMFGAPLSSAQIGLAEVTVELNH